MNFSTSTMGGTSATIIPPSEVTAKLSSTTVLNVEQLTRDVIDVLQRALFLESSPSVEDEVLPANVMRKESDGGTAGKSGHQTKKEEEGEKREDGFESVPFPPSSLPGSIAPIPSSTPAQPRLQRSPPPEENDEGETTKQKKQKTKSKKPHPKKVGTEKAGENSAIAAAGAVLLHFSQRWWSSHEGLQFFQYHAYSVVLPLLFCTSDLPFLSALEWRSEDVFESADHHLFSLVAQNFFFSPTSPPRSSAIPPLSPLLKREGQWASPLAMRWMNFMFKFLLMALRSPMPFHCSSSDERSLRIGRAGGSNGEHTESEKCFPSSRTLCATTTRLGSTTRSRQSRRALHEKDEKAGAAEAFSSSPSVQKSSSPPLFTSTSEVVDPPCEGVGECKKETEEEMKAQKDEVKTQCYTHLYLTGCMVFIDRLQEGLRWLEDALRTDGVCVAPSLFSAEKKEGMKGEEEAAVVAIGMEYWERSLKLLGFCASYVVSSLKCAPELLLQATVDAEVFLHEECNEEENPREEAGALPKRIAKEEGDASLSFPSCSLTECHRPLTVWSPPSSAFPLHSRLSDVLPPSLASLRRRILSRVIDCHQQVCRLLSWVNTPVAPPSLLPSGASDLPIRPSGVSAERQRNAKEATTECHASPTDAVQKGGPTFSSASADSVWSCEWRHRGYRVQFGQRLTTFVERRLRVAIEVLGEGMGAALSRPSFAAGVKKVSLSSPLSLTTVRTRNTKRDGRHEKDGREEVFQWRHATPHQEDATSSLPLSPPRSSLSAPSSRAPSSTVGVSSHPNGGRTERMDHHAEERTHAKRVRELSRNGDENRDERNSRMHHSYCEDDVEMDRVGMRLFDVLLPLLRPSASSRVCPLPPSPSPLDAAHGMVKSDEVGSSRMRCRSECSETGPPTHPAWKPPHSFSPMTLERQRRRSEKGEQGSSWESAAALGRCIAFFRGGARHCTASSSCSLFPSPPHRMALLGVVVLLLWFPGVTVEWMKPFWPLLFGGHSFSLRWWEEEEDTKRNQWGEGDVVTTGKEEISSDESIRQGVGESGGEAAAATPPHTRRTESPIGMATTAWEAEAEVQKKKGLPPSVEGLPPPSSFVSSPPRLCRQAAVLFHTIAEMKEVLPHEVLWSVEHPRLDSSSSTLPPTGWESGDMGGGPNRKGPTARPSPAEGSEKEKRGKNPPTAPSKEEKKEKEEMEEAEEERFSTQWEGVLQALSKSIIETGSPAPHDAQEPFLGEVSFVSSCGEGETQDDARVGSGLSGMVLFSIGCAFLSNVLATMCNDDLGGPPLSFLGNDPSAFTRSAPLLWSSSLLWRRALQGVWVPLCQRVADCLSATLSPASPFSLEAEKNMEEKLEDALETHSPETERCLPRQSPQRNRLVLLLPSTPSSFSAVRPPITKDALHRSRSEAHHTQEQDASLRCTSQPSLSSQRWRTPAAFFFRTLIHTGSQLLATSGDAATHHRESHLPKEAGWRKRAAVVTGLSSFSSFGVPYPVPDSVAFVQPHRIALVSLLASLWCSVTMSIAVSEHNGKWDDAHLEGEDDAEKSSSQRRPDGTSYGSWRSHDKDHHERGKTREETAMRSISPSHVFALLSSSSASSFPSLPSEKANADNEEEKKKEEERNVNVFLSLMDILWTYQQQRRPPPLRPLSEAAASTTTVPVFLPIPPFWMPEVEEEEHATTQEWNASCVSPSVIPSSPLPSPLSRGSYAHSTQPLIISSSSFSSGWMEEADGSRYKDEKRAAHHTREAVWCGVLPSPVPCASYSAPRLVSASLPLRLSSIWLSEVALRGGLALVPPSSSRFPFFPSLPMSRFSAFYAEIGTLKGIQRLVSESFASSSFSSSSSSLSPSPRPVHGCVSFFLSLCALWSFAHHRVDVPLSRLALPTAVTQGLAALLDSAALPSDAPSWTPRTGKEGEKRIAFPKRERTSCEAETDSTERSERKRRRASVDVHGGNKRFPTGVSLPSSPAAVLASASAPSLSPSLVHPPADIGGCAGRAGAMAEAQPTLFHYWGDYPPTATAIDASQRNKKYNEEDDNDEVHVVEKTPLVTPLPSSPSLPLSVKSEDTPKKDATREGKRRKRRSLEAGESRPHELVNSMMALTSLLEEWEKENIDSGDDEEEQEDGRDPHHQSEKEEVFWKKRRSIKEAWDRLVKVGKRVL